MRLWPKRRPRTAEVIQALGPTFAQAIAQSIPRELTVNHTLPQPGSVELRVISDYDGRLINTQSLLLSPTASIETMAIRIPPMEEERVARGFSVTLRFTPAPRRNW